MLSKINDAIEDIKQGKFVIIVDDEDRENEGDLVLASEKVTPSKVNFMLINARGLLCVPTDGKRLDQLGLHLMTQTINGNRCAFTISVDYKNGIKTGVSVSDRAKTIKALTDEKNIAENFAIPGHIFPIRYREDGVLQRRGHTEASVDLVKLAGLYPSAVICEILNEEGATANSRELLQFSKENYIKIISIDDLANHQETIRIH